jgi:hypothetical protein
MPTILRISGYIFYFYANEGSEPPHIHVDKAGATAKLWLTPLRWAYNHGFSPAEQKAIKNIIVEHRDYIQERWDEFVGE